MASTTTLDPLVTEDPSVSLGRHGIGVTGLTVAYWRDQPVFCGVAMRLNGPGWFHLGATNGTG